MTHTGATTLCSGDGLESKHVTQPTWGEADVVQHWHSQHMAALHKVKSKM
jgi:hypothetical protein